MALIAALLLTMATPPGPVVAALAGIATLGLAFDRRLGPLPAALLVVLAIPFGRAADNDTYLLLGVPLRPQDAAIMVGAVLAVMLPARGGLRRSPVPWLAAGFLAVGVVGVAIGMASDHATRDILRDARWWGLYAFVLLGAWRPMGRVQLTRSLVAGSILYSVFLIVVLAGPAFAGGLKERALEYDWGTLRLQFSNGAFVVASLAFAAARLVRRPTLRTAALVALFGFVTVLSLTRTSMVVALGVLALVALIALFENGVAPRVLWPAFVRTVRGLAVATACLAAAAVLAVGSLIVLPRDGVVSLIAAAVRDAGSLGPSAPDPTPAPGEAGENPFDRITFNSPNSDAAAIEQGRFGTYRNALVIIERRPLVGSGLGVLVKRSFTFGGSKPATPGAQPGVDNAYLTVAMKSGVVGAAVYALLALAVLRAALLTAPRLRAWFLPAWAGLLVFTMTQSFATSGSGPFALAVLMLLPLLVGRIAPAKRA